MQDNVFSRTFPLHDAVCSMNLARVKELVEAGFDVNANNDQGKMPLHMFDYQYDLTVQKEMLRFFLCNGASLNINDGSTVAMHILQRGNIDLIKMLILYGVNLLVATECNGMTLLHHVARNRNPGVIELIFEVYTINVNTPDNIKWTPLHHAVLFKNVYAVEFLLKNGANVHDAEIGSSSLAICFLMNHDKNKWEDTLTITELYLSYGVNCGNYPAFFEFILMGNALVLAEPLIADLAMREALGVSLEKYLILEINSHEKFRNYFNLCKQMIKELKRTVVYNRITLFTFLEENENRLALYARNQDCVVKLKRVLNSKRNSDLYIMKTLRKRIAKALETAKLREESAAEIAKFPGFPKNRDLIDIIIMYLNNQDLENICKV